MFSRTGSYTNIINNKTFHANETYNVSYRTSPRPTHTHTSGKNVRVMYTSLNTSFKLQNWGMQGCTYFSYFGPKHRLWVLVRTALLTCIHELCFDENIKNIKFFLMKIFIFYNFIKSMYIAWACFRYEPPPHMEILWSFRWLQSI